MKKGRQQYLKKSILSCLLVIAVVISNLYVVPVRAATTKSTNVSKNLKVSSKKKNPTNIQLNTYDMTLKVGETKKLKVTLSPKNNVNKKVTYKSDDKDLISISSSGTVKGLTEGTCSIIVSTVNGLVAVCSVTVVEADSSSTTDGSSNNNSSNSSTDIKVTGITMDKTATVALGGTYTLATSITPSNASNKTITYSLSNDNITITNQGVITGNKYGQTIVTAKTSNGLSAYCVVTVSGTVSSTEPVAVYLNTTAITIGLFSSYQIRPTLSPSTATTNITYISSDTKVATVDNNGLVTGLSKGVATIYVLTSNGKSNTCVITVSDQDVGITSIQFAQANVSLNVNTSQQLTTYVLPSNAANTGITYSSADPSIATVTSTGVVTGIKVGTTKIYAVTSNGKYSECTVTVYNNVQNSYVVSYGSVIVNGTQIAYGESLENMIAKLGQPTQVEANNSFGYQFFIYKNSSNNTTLMIAIYNNKVAGFVSIG
jgi:uncharacterized protein YjdB